MHHRAIATASDGDSRNWALRDAAASASSLRCQRPSGLRSFSPRIITPRRWHSCATTSTSPELLGLDRDAHYAGSGIEARGRVAFAALRNGRPEILHLVDGDLLRAGEQTVRANRAYAGDVVGILRRDAGDAVNAFVVDQPPPADYQLPGRWLTVELGDGVLHRFPISEVRRDQGRTWLVVGDEEPGLALEAGAGKAMQEGVRYTRYLWRPHACVLGPLRFRVTDQTTYQR